MLAELKEYATEVDVDFVRKAVRAIGRCAIKVEVGGDYVQILSVLFNCKIEVFIYAPVCLYLSSVGSEHGAR